MAAMLTTDPTKAGVTTSEFGLSVGGIIAVGAVALGIIQQDQVDAFSHLIEVVLAGLGAMAAIAGIVLQWMKQRHELKMRMLGSTPVTQ